MFKKIFSGVLSILLVLSMLTFTFNIQPVKAEPTTIIVPDDYPTIQAAVNAATPGDTIIVREGNYTENVDVNKDHLTIRSEKGAANTVVQAANSSDHVFETTADYVNIIGFTVTKAVVVNKAGIFLYYADYCNISDNKALGNDCGIWLHTSSNNILSNNIASNGRHGISLWPAFNNNTLTNNTMSENYYNFGIFAGSLSNYIQNIDSSNKINGKPIYYWVDQHNKQIPSDAGFVGIVNCTNIIVESLNLAKNGQGVFFAYSNDSRIENVNASNNGYGVWLQSSHNITVATDKVISNWRGIYAWDATNNIIYLNNFIGNVQNAYCYPTLTNWWNSQERLTYIYNGKTYTNYLGNYWSDYTDVDLYSGPYQNETGNDGIWDHPYVIDADNQDCYPLVNQWTPTPKITSIDPPQPIAFGTQFLTILGDGFVPDSSVTLSSGSTTYPPIPRGRTRFIDPNKIEVVVGLGYAEGDWQVWVTNPDGSQSNKQAFRTREPSLQDGRKVLDLALQYWHDDVETAVKMVAIAKAESGWSPNAVGDPEPGGYTCMGYASWGLWMIHMPSQIPDDFLKNLGAPIDGPYYYETAEWLRDPNYNAKAARAVFDRAKKSFTPWHTYNTESYKKALNEVRKMLNEMRVSVFKCPVNVTITDNYDRIVSEVENQIPGASFEYFNATDTKIFYLPLNLTYRVQINATDYGNCTIGQITPTESIYEIAFSQATFNLTSETVAEFDLLPYDANYTLKVDENGDGTIEYELIPEVETLTTEYDIGITNIVPSKTVIGQGYNLPINITIMNYGAHTETFNATIFADRNTTIIGDEIIIGTQIVHSLTNGTSAVITFTWNTTGVAKGNYTISAVADNVPGETDTADNTFIDGIVKVVRQLIISGPHYTQFGIEYWIVELVEGKACRLVSNYY